MGAQVEEIHHLRGQCTGLVALAAGAAETGDLFHETGPHRIDTAQHDVVAHAQALEQGQVLEGTRHAQPRQTCSGHLPETLSGQADRSLRGPVQPAHDIDQRTLARAVGTDHGQDLAFMQGQVDMTQGLHATEGQADALQLQDRRDAGLHRALRRCGGVCPRMGGQRKLKRAAHAHATASSACACCGAAAAVA